MFEPVFRSYTFKILDGSSKTTIFKLQYLAVLALTQTTLNQHGRLDEQQNSMESIKMIFDPGYDLLTSNKQHGGYGIHIPSGL